MNETMPIDHIEVKKKKENYLFGAVLWPVIVALVFIIPAQRRATIQFFVHDWSWIKLLYILLFSGMPLLCLYFCFYGRVNVKMDQQGIWTKKNGLVAWDDVWYFYSTVTADNQGDEYRLMVKLKDRLGQAGEEFTSRFQNMNYPFTTIRAVIEFYSSKYNFNDLGHEKK